MAFVPTGERLGWPAFFERVERALADTGSSGTAVAVVCADTGGFDAAAPITGAATRHPSIALGRLLGSVVRPTDTLALMDGEVLAVVFERLTGPGDARRLRHRLAAATQRAAWTGARASGLRLGMAYSEGDDDPQHLVAWALASMGAPEPAEPAAVPDPHRRRPAGGPAEGPLPVIARLDTAVHQLMHARLSMPASVNGRDAQVADDLDAALGALRRAALRILAGEPPR